MRPAPRVLLRTRFLIAAALLVFTTAVTSIGSTLLLGDLADTLGSSVQESDAITAATTELAAALEREDDALVRSLRPDPSDAGILIARRQVVDDALTRLRSVAHQPAKLEKIEVFEADLQRYRGAGDELAQAPIPDRVDRYLRNANPLLRAAGDHISDIRSEHFLRSQQVAERGATSAQRARRLMVGVTLAALLISLLIALHLAQTIVYPLQALARGVDAIRQTDFGHRLPVRRDDELGDLTRAFNTMASSLEAFQSANLSEILRAKQTLEQTLSALPDATLLLDEGGRVIQANPAALAMTVDGQPPQQISDLRFDDAATRLLERGRHDPDTLPTTLEQALEWQHDGTRRSFLPRIIPLADPDAPRSLLVLSDVTDLTRVDQMRSDLVAVAAHELGTPLTTLQMSLHMLDETIEPEPGRTQDLLKASLDGTRQLTALVEAYLDFTRLEAGRLRLDLADVVVAEVVEEAHCELLPTATSAEATLLTRLPDPALALRCDRRLLRSVLVNLIANAIKYSPPHGEVVISARPTAPTHDRGPGVEIEVTDEGPGVPEPYRARIFERFFRVEHDRPDEPGTPRGSGVGLFLCREIVQLHGGTIRCEATLNGQGARLVAWLPQTTGET